MQGILLTGFFQDLVTKFDRAFFREQRYLAYLDGLKVTLIISILAVLLGIAIGLVVAVAKVASSRNKKLWLLNKICNIYLTVIRGTPVMVQLLIIANWIFTSRDSSEIVIGAIASESIPAPMWQRSSVQELNPSTKDRWKPDVLSVSTTYRRCDSSLYRRQSKTFCRLLVMN